MLGRALTEELAGKHDADCFDLCDFDLLDDLAVTRALDLARPHAVVNCAAYTAVDLAESEPDQAREINAAAPGRIAARCRERGVRFVHIGTDYVFDGQKIGAYLEDDPTGPLNVYGRTKLEGERLARAAHPDGHLILRTSWLFGDQGQCFPRTMLDRFASGQTEFKVVNDQRGRPTYAGDLARVIRLGLEKGLTGLYHACNGGAVTWFDFAREIFEQAGAKVRVEPVGSSGFPRPARRPANSVLDTGRLDQALGETMPHHRDALGRWIDRRRR
jgi:dTDP-4-dehydrorhamnose reductase